MNNGNSESSVFRRKFLLSFTLFALTLVAGTYGYWFIGGGKYSVLDCFYMTVITVATVGYSEVVAVSGDPAGMLFTISLIFAGMSVILYFFSNVTAFLIEGDIKEIFRRKKMRKLISQMKDHYIVCGVGKLGWHVIDELYQTGRPALAIDMEPGAASSVIEKFPGVGAIAGDATDNDILTEAGIERAKGLIAATGHDKDNLVLTLTARQLNPGMRIVARCNDIKNTERLRKAGADSVVSSNFIGGLRMASEMIRPAAVTFLDSMLRDRGLNLRIEEIKVPQGSPLSGRPVAGIKGRALLLAVIKEDGSYQYNPPDGMPIAPGMSLIIMGTPEDKRAIESGLGA